MISSKKCVSVFIPTFNGEKYIAATITAVLDQKVPEGYDLELLIIDSGSRDETVEIIKKFLSDQRVKLIEIPNKQFGHGKTRQLAVAKTRGEFVLFLTQDATPANSLWLRNMIKPFQLSDQVGCVFGRQIPRWDAVPTIKREVASVFANFGPSGAIIFNQNPNNYFFSDVNSAVSRKSIAKVPFRDLPYAEDQALAQDMMKHGFVKAYAPDGAVNHSNEYTMREFFGRKFDEFIGLQNSVDYTLKPSKKSLWLGWIKPAWADIKFTLRDREYGKKRKLKYFWLAIGYNISVARARYAAAKYFGDDDAVNQLSLEARAKRSIK